MRDRELYAKILGGTTPWTVVEVELREEDASSGRTWALIPMLVPDLPPAVASNVTAGLVLAARSLARSRERTRVVDAYGHADRGDGRRDAQSRLRACATRAWASCRRSSARRVARRRSASRWPTRHSPTCAARCCTCYPLDAVVDALAIFDGKRTAGTLPDDVDARYLLGIVKNIYHCHEADSITAALLRERLAARDRLLDPLVRERDAILTEIGTDIATVLDAITRRITDAERIIDRHFWLDAAAAALPEDDEHRRRLLPRDPRRTTTTTTSSARVSHPARSHRPTLCACSPCLPHTWRSWQPSGALPW